MTTTDEITFPGPDEIEGFWNLDKMHAPRPVTPLSFDLVVRTLAEGFTKAQAEYDCPIMVSTKEVNHYFYVAFHPIPDEAEIADRMTRYHGKLAEMVPGVGKTWDEEWKPEVIASNVPLKTVDWSALSDGELVTKLDELTDQMRHQWWIHGHINFVLLSSSAFCDLYDAAMRPDDPTESYQTLHGFPTTSVDASRGLWALSRTVLASPALKELFQSTEPEDLPAALDASEEGRAFRQQLDDFLFEYGWRHDAVYDLADVPWRENPAIPLASIAKMMELDESDDPEVVYQQKVARREELLAAARARLADEPETLASFDELYEPARYSFPLTEDHAFYIDQLFISVFRRFCLAVGERLVAKGVVDEPDDVFYLYRDEVVDALTEGGDRRASGRRPAGEHGPGSPGRRADGARHPAPAPRRPGPVHGRARLPAARLRPAQGEPRSGHAHGRGRVTGCLHRDGQGGAIAERGDRPRGRRGHGVRDDAAALGAGVLGGRRHRRRLRRRALPHGDRGPRVRRSRRGRHRYRHDRHPDGPDHHRRRHQGARVPRRPERDRGRHGPDRLVAGAPPGR